MAVYAVSRSHKRIFVFRKVDASIVMRICTHNKHLGKVFLAMYANQFKSEVERQKTANVRWMNLTAKAFHASMFMCDDVEMIHGHANGDEYATFKVVGSDCLDDNRGKFFGQTLPVYNGTAVAGQTVRIEPAPEPHTFTTGGRRYGRNGRRSPFDEDIQFRPKTAEEKQRQEDHDRMVDDFMDLINKRRGR